MAEEQAKTNETGGEQQAQKPEPAPAKPAKARPTKQQLKAELDALEAKGSINNADATRIHKLRRELKEHK